MKRYIITALCAFVAYCAWGQMNSPCFAIPIPSNTPATYALHNFTQDSTVLDLDNTLMYAFAISGEVTLLSENNSSVKVILVDNTGVQHLVYEVNSLLTNTNSFVIENIGRETLWDNPIYASSLVVRLKNARLQLNAITPVTELLANATPQQRVLRTQEQNDTIVNALNRNLIAHDIPWRAGTTNLSDASYDVRRGVLGDNNPFDNIEYYIGGYYVDPAFDATQSPAIDDGYVEEFDWRNRHGKNWITPAKQQWRSDCWAFAAIANGESYINLYYNDIKNIDLSEQQLDSVVLYSTFADGGVVKHAYTYMTQNELVTETCYPYKYSSPTNKSNNVIYTERSRCENPDTTFRFSNYSYINNCSQLKNCLIKQPCTLSIKSWDHSVECIGYKKLVAGDTTYYYTPESHTYPDTTFLWNHENYIVISDNSPYKNHTALTLKNSWWWYQSRKGDWPLEDGIGIRYMILPNNLLLNFAYFSDTISSNILSTEDIICSDADNDGYYFWGIGEKPAHCPAWAPDIPDGDDSNPYYGAMDEYGYLQDIGPQHNAPFIMENDITLTTPQILDCDLVIPSGVTLVISSYLTMHPDAQILIQGGRLVLDGGTIRNGYIRNKGDLVVKNNGVIEMCDNDQYEHNPDDLDIINNGKTPFVISTTLKQSAFKRIDR